MKNDLEYFTQYQLNDTSARVYEHETLFSFNNDSGNYAFNEWWITAGKDAYNQWCENNLEELNINYA